MKRILNLKKKVMERQGTVLKNINRDCPCSGLLAVLIRWHGIA